MRLAAIVMTVVAMSTACSSSSGAKAPTTAPVGSVRCELTDFRASFLPEGPEVAPSDPRGGVACRMRDGRRLTQRQLTAAEATEVLAKIDALPRLASGASVACGSLPVDAPRTAVLFLYQASGRVFVAIGPCGVVASAMGRRSLSGEAGQALVALVGSYLT